MKIKEKGYIAGTKRFRNDPKYYSLTLHKVHSIKNDICEADMEEESDRYSYDGSDKKS